MVSLVGALPNAMAQSSETMPETFGESTTTNCNLHSACEADMKACKQGVSESPRNLCWHRYFCTKLFRKMRMYGCVSK